jgi:DNA polymerase III alpha subunit (gram-positive type)
MRKVYYLFPKAHAAHYTKLAVAFAWFKVNCPEAFYRTSLEYLEVQPYMSYSDEELEIILENLNTYEYESRKERDGVSLLLEARQRGYT